MPPRRQLSGAAEVRKSNEKRGQFKERCRQGVEIHESGFKVYPCRHCTSENKECFIMPEKYEKCNACTRRGKSCVREFHTEILRDGAMPMDILETKMKAWTDASK